MPEFYYDFHIHSCLSPCGSDDMTPQNIVGMAALAGYNIIAVSDHNSTGNCKAVIEAASQSELLAIPAMELTTKEEVHVLCLLPTIEAAEEFGKYVYEKLPDIKNKAKIFGNQLYVDAKGHIIGEEEKLLISATDIGIYDVCSLIKIYGGTAIPAHIDRQSFSLISNLGFCDPAMQFCAVELSLNCDANAFKQLHNINLPHVINSDSHGLEQIPDPVHKIRINDFSVKAVIEAIENCKNENLFV